MGKIRSIRFGQARIILDDTCVRLFVRYKGNYCSDIRIWKLPKNNNLFSMFRSKNLFWAVSDNTAKTLQGWFYKDGDLLKTLANKIAQCSNEKELKRFCFDLENIFTNGLSLDTEEDIKIIPKIETIPQPIPRKFIFTKYPVPPNNILYAVERVIEFEKILENIERKSIKDIINNLNRAPEPLTEIIIMETAACVYQQFIKLHPNVSFKAKRELYMLLRLPDSSLKLMFSEDLRELEYIDKKFAFQARNNFNRILEQRLNSVVEKAFEIMAKSRKSVWFDYPSTENGKNTMIDYVPDSKELNYTIAFESRDLFPKSKIKENSKEEYVLYGIGEELIYGAFILNSIGGRNKVYKLKEDILKWQTKFLLRITPDSEPILETSEVKTYFNECVNFGLKISKLLPEKLK